MTQEDKQLLLKDLSARLPYSVKCINVAWPKDGYVRISNIRVKEQKVQIFEDWVDIEYCKPYLRPMSSMTEEESNEFESITFPLMKKDWDGNENPACIRCIDIPKYMNFILSHHFDYQGLIEKGLALEAPEDIYNIK